MQIHSQFSSPPQDLLQSNQSNFATIKSTNRVGANKHLFSSLLLSAVLSVQNPCDCPPPIPLKFIIASAEGKLTTVHLIPSRSSAIHLQLITTTSIWVPSGVGSFLYHFQLHLIFLIWCAHGHKNIIYWLRTKSLLIEMSVLCESAFGSRPIWNFIAPHNMLTSRQQLCCKIGSIDIQNQCKWSLGATRGCPIRVQPQSICY